MSDKKPEYRRMTKAEISAAFNRLDLSPNEFCRLTGSAYKRVVGSWLEGDDIPQWVPALLASWLASPEAFEAARQDAMSRLIG